MKEITVAAVALCFLCIDYVMSCVHINNAHCEIASCLWFRWNVEKKRQSVMAFLHFKERTFSRQTINISNIKTQIANEKSVYIFEWMRHKIALASNFKHFYFHTWHIQAQREIEQHTFVQLGCVIHIFFVKLSNLASGSLYFGKRERERAIQQKSKSLMIYVLFRVLELVSKSMLLVRCFFCVISYLLRSHNSSFVPF